MYKYKRHKVFWLFSKTSHKGLAKADDEGNDGEQTEIVRMKYEYLQTHTARRSFCSNEYLKGTDPIIIMAMSGHKSHKLFMRYIKVSNEQFADKMAKIWQERELAGV